jgi:2-polyprenyl-6-methoxyphenol hydroxylase-like FAD-dependent oxidoreductase
VGRAAQYGALDILKQMDIYSTILDNKTNITSAVCVDKDGNEVIQMSTDLLGTRLENVDLEIMRGELCLIMKEQLENVECLFGDSIKEISENLDGISVSFEKGETRTFDLVIGSDGLHSIVRNMVFGDEIQFSKDMGVCVAVFSIPNFLFEDDCEIELHTRQRFVNIYKDKKNATAKAAIAFSVTNAFHSRDPNEQKKLIEEVFADIGWKMPQIIEAMKESSDFFFDSMAQIHMPTWSKGRIALVGDAAYSATPMSGQGTSIAIAGAYVLAGELLEANGDYRTAFSQYEKQMRPFIDENQALANMSARIMENSFYSNFIYQVLSFMPSKVIHYFKKQALERTTKAANAINLKDYSKDSYN